MCVSLQPNTTNGARALLESSGIYNSEVAVPLSEVVLWVMFGRQVGRTLLNVVRPGVGPTTPTSRRLLHTTVAQAKTQTPESRTLSPCLESSLPKQRAQNSQSSVYAFTPDTMVPYKPYRRGNDQSMQCSTETPNPKPLRGGNDLHSVAPPCVARHAGAVFGGKKPWSRS